VYLIIVLPLVTPVTIPDEFILAIAPSSLLHIPPEVASLSGMVDPMHTSNDGAVVVMGATEGKVVTVISAVIAVEHPLPPATV